MLGNTVQEFLKKKDATPYPILDLPPTQCKIYFLKLLGEKCFKSQITKTGKDEKMIASPSSHFILVYTSILSTSNPTARN